MPSSVSNRHAAHLSPTREGMRVEPVSAIAIDIALRVAAAIDIQSARDAPREHERLTPPSAIDRGGVRPIGAAVRHRPAEPMPPRVIGRAPRSSPLRARIR
ncbi:hypothetical protein [Burkholderia sp. ABCPW 14]|uniref:hypothetical protein n=1 Tax=Burkholderia sp. ABCPW 14 TaxID=1637860 RepID=UPI0012E3424B|nr:hypothetical protein [Burkholderia sp. ABCPW 14]